MMDFSVRILRPSDAADPDRFLVAASVAHGSPKRSPEWFRWKYCGSPFGPAVFAYAEAKDGQVGGVVAFGLSGLTRGKADVKGALSYETFTRPDFRRRGLFTRLLRFAMDECGDRGVEMMFNFPNRASLPGFTKQGWVKANCLRSFVRPLRWGGFLAAVSNVMRRAPFTPDSITSFAPRDYEGFDECLSTVESIRSHVAWATARTPEYLIWRYRTYPMNRYVVVRDEMGWAVVRTGKRGVYSEAQIMELFPHSEHSAAFIRAICSQVAQRVDPDIITITLSRAHPICTKLPLVGFCPAPNRANFCYYPLRKELQLYNQAWILTAADFHTY